MKKTIQKKMPNHNPTERAEVLVKETSLPAHEIAKMTGLDVYQVFGMKLKARTLRNIWSNDQVAF